MEAYIITSITTFLFAIATFVLGYLNLGKYQNLANVIYNALKDGKLTSQEVQDIIEAYKATKEQ